MQRAAGIPVMKADITGDLLAVRVDNPNASICVVVEGVNFLAIFSDEDKLRAAMELINIPPDEYTIKEITDSAEFLDSTLPKVRVARNMRIEDGKSRWTEITITAKDNTACGAG